VARQIKYACATCGRGNCKLWREYSTFLDHTTLECGACALKSQGKEGPIDADGTRAGTGVGPRFRTDQIGWRVPAVPDALPNKRGYLPKNTTFWGYTSTPREAIDWWKALPT